MTNLTGATNLTVGGSSAAILTHEYNNSGTEDHKLNLTISTLTIAANGQINAAGLGYTGGSGPGVPAGGGGASYGGQGGSGGTPGVTYGLYNAPVNIGSGGRCGGCTSGGGAIILNVANTLTVNGPISAAGIGGGNNSSSGGSIFLTVGSTLAGNSTIDASGGSAGAGGGGGRIAVIGSTTSFAGTIKAYGGTGTAGAAGTIFIQAPGEANGTLIVNNNNVVSNFATYLTTNTTPMNVTFDSIQTLGKSSMTFVSYSTVTIISTGNVFRRWRLHFPRSPSTVFVSGGVHHERVQLRLDGHLGHEPECVQPDVYARRFDHV